MGARNRKSPFPFRETISSSLVLGTSPKAKSIFGRAAVCIFLFLFAGLASRSGELPAQEDVVLGQEASVETVKASLRALLQILANDCGHHLDREQTLAYWTYQFLCPLNEPFFVKSEHDFMLTKGKSTGDMPPKVLMGDIGYPGQQLDFVVSQLFFLHPKPMVGGRYLEIGAYYGLQFTNTLFFEQYLGWSGWLFEPTNGCFEKCVENRPRDTVFQQGLCETDKIVEFRGFGQCKPRNSTCTPLTSIPRDWEKGFDFVSVDVEGREMDVLRAIDFERVPIKVLLIEWRRRNGKSREEYLKQFGYVQVGIIHNKGWDNGDEIFYRPDLISPHIFFARGFETDYFPWNEEASS